MGPPSDFLASCSFPHPLTLSVTHSHVNMLKDLMNQLQYRQPCSSNNLTFVHEDLTDCTHVFVRNDAKKPPLQPTYNGPFKVVDCKPRHLLSLVTMVEQIVSIDRLKPAYSMASLDTHIEQSHSSLSSQPSHILPPFPLIQTKSGRHVQFPDLIALVIKVLSCSNF